MSNFKINILYVLFILSLFSCSRIDEYKFTKKASTDLNELDQLRIYIEKKYESVLNDKSKNIILFPNEFNPVIKYKIDIFDGNVIEKLNKLGYSEIEIDKNNDNTLSEMNFTVGKNSYFPIVLVKYEYSGTSKFYQSDTYYYRPINKNWSIVIDSTR